MSRSRRARWINAGAFSVLAIVQFATSQPTLTSRWIIPGALLGVAAWLSPVFRSAVGSITHAEATRLLDEAAPGQEPVIVYHRPGCTFCARLKAALIGVQSKAYWVDVWDDPEGSEFIKSVNGGYETVPTVVIAGIPQTNPNPGAVRAALAG